MWAQTTRPWICSRASIPVPDGVSYNAYVIRDEKTALLDTVDPRATNQWLEQVTEVLDGTAPDYLVISHMEPDHAGAASGRSQNTIWT